MGTPDGYATQQASGPNQSSPQRSSSTALPCPDPIPHGTIQVNVDAAKKAQVRTSPKLPQVLLEHPALKLYP